MAPRPQAPFRVHSTAQDCARIPPPVQGPCRPCRRLGPVSASSPYCEPCRYAPRWSRISSAARACGHGTKRNPAARWPRGSGCFCVSGYALEAELGLEVDVVGVIVVGAAVEQQAVAVDEVAGADGVEDVAGEEVGIADIQREIDYL